MFSDRSIFLCAALVCCAIPAYCQDPISNTALRDLINAAVANNQELAALQTRSLEAKGLLRQAGVKPPLTFDGGVASGRPLGTVGEEEYSAGLGRTIERGGKRTRRVELAEVRVAQVESEYRERLRQLSYEIKLRYVDALSDSRRLQILDAMLAGNQRSLDVTRARVEKGDAAKLDQSLIEVELGRMDADRASVVGRLEAALTDLRRLASLAAPLPATLDSAFSLGPLDRDLETLKKTANELRPDLAMARLVERFGEAEMRLVDAEGRPDVTVTARYFKRSGQFDDQYGTTSGGARTLLRDQDDILAIGVSVPILTKRRNLGNMEAAQARVLGARQRSRFLENAIPLEVESAWRSWVSTRKTASILESSVLPQAQKNLEIVQQAYQLGQLRILDVLNEQRRLLDTRLAALENLSVAAKSFASLERAVGGDIQ
ncbi:MAG: TolC family protein [Acidobacteria bacterium]|nr:TolC family protein [Acidobacteriota bacterium]